MKVRTKAVLVLTTMTLVPVGASVALLVEANRRPVQTSEEGLQLAVLDQVAAEPGRILHEVENDAVAVAAVLSRAASGAIRDEDAIESVRALIGSRDTIDAVRFEVPSAKVSTVIRQKESSAEVPESTAELRALADERGHAFAVLDPGRGLVVVSIKADKADAKAPKGYVVAKADLRKLGPAVEEVARQRFAGNVGLLVASHDRKAVASFGIDGVSPGSPTDQLPIWQMLPKGTPWDQQVGGVREYTANGVPMVGAIKTIPDIGWVVASFRPQSVAYESLADMRRRGLAVAGAAVVLALVVGLLVARGLTAPLLRVVDQVRLVGQRRWRDLTLGTKRSDEIGELFASLGDMAKDLEQGEKEVALRADLSRFMSKPLVDAIVRREHSLSLGGKRAPISVLFADVVGFTPLAESRGAEQVVALLNELFTVLTEIVFRHGGTVDKFIGDCIMAVWGAPVAQEDHAARALAAAEDMMRFLETANEGWKEKYDVEVRLGIGVNSGEAIVGNIGSDKRMEYTVVGDVVNVAARLEGIAQPNQVLVAESTQKLAGEAFALRRLGERRLTGRKNETAVFELEVG